MPANLNRWSPLLALLFGAFMLFVHLGTLPLIAPDEGRNAEVAREMKLSGAWLAPTYDGITYLDKPAFYFKTIALSFSLFGESEATARLSSAVFGFLLLITSFLFCRKVYGQLTASLAAIIIATTPLYIAFSRYVIFDMTLAFFVCSTVFACYLAEDYRDKRRRQWYLLAALTAGIATLVKGPVGFLLPTLVVVLLYWAEGKLSALKRCFAPVNWLVFFAVFLPWFVGLSLQCPDFPYYGIMKESISRFATKEFHRSKPFYFYALIIASCFFPWSLLLPESMVAAWRARKNWLRADRLFLVWAVAVVAFFSVSQSKLPGYILTAMLALGVLTARVFAEALENPNGKGAGIVQRGTLILAVASSIMAFVLAAVFWESEIMVQGLRLKGRFLQLFQPAIPAMAGSFGFVAVIAFLAVFLKNQKLALASFLAVPVLLMTVNFNALSIVAAAKSSRQLAQSLPDNLSEETEIACLECMPNGLAFYTKRLVTVISKDGSELTSNYILFTLNSGKQWPERIVPLDKREEWLASRTHPVYLMADGENVAILKEIAEQRGVGVEPLVSGYFAALLPKP